MERTPLHDLSKDDLVGLIVQLREQLQGCERLIREQTRLIDEQSRRILDALLDIYRRGKAIAADQRLSEVGRRSRVQELVDAP